MIKEIEKIIEGYKFKIIHLENEDIIELDQPVENIIRAECVLPYNVQDDFVIPAEIQLSLLAVFNNIIEMNNKIYGDFEFEIPFYMVKNGFNDFNFTLVHISFQKITRKSTNG